MHPPERWIRTVFSYALPSLCWEQRVANVSVIIRHDSPIVFLNLSQMRLQCRIREFHVNPNFRSVCASASDLMIQRSNVTVDWVPHLLEGTIRRFCLTVSVVMLEIGRNNRDSIEQLSTNVRLNRKLIVRSHTSDYGEIWKLAIYFF